MKTFSKGFYYLFERLMNLAVWNTIWLLHTLMGLVVFGWAPATAALFSVMREEKQEGKDLRKWQSFFSYYKKGFLKANIIGFLIIAGALSLLFSFYTLAYMDIWIRMTAGTILFVLLVLYCLTAIFIFPVFIHYKTTLRKHIRYSLLIGLAYLPQSLLIGLTIVLIGVLYQMFPGLILFYLMSLPVAAILPVALHVFKLIEQKQSKQSLWQGGAD